MLINGEKFACEACVRGHRVSSCHHSGNTPLLPLVLVHQTNSIRVQTGPLSMSTRKAVRCRNATTAEVSERRAPSTSNANVRTSHTQKKIVLTYGLI